MAEPPFPPPDPKRPYDWSRDVEWGDGDPGWQTWLALIAATMALAVAMYLLFTIP